MAAPANARTHSAKKGLLSQERRSKKGRASRRPAAGSVAVDGVDAAALIDIEDGNCVSVPFHSHGPYLFMVPRSIVVDGVDNLLSQERLSKLAE